MKKNILIDRINHIINLGNSFYDNLVHNEPTEYGYVKSGDFSGYKTIGLSFIENLFGKDHTYFIEFKKSTQNSWSYQLDESLSILNSIKFELENGWLDTITKIVSAELFADFLEMSKYLLDNQYKDAAAVMIGSLLEEKIRLLCKENLIEITVEKNGKIAPKKASIMNDELYKNHIYNSLIHKSVISWLDLRNSAAHGHYDQYSIENVNIMYDGVLNFLANN